MITIKRLLALSIAAVAAATASMSTLAPVGQTGSAHTAMLRASPDRAAIAGGATTFVDLEFLEPVSQAVVTATYNGTPVVGATTMAEGEIIAFTLSQPVTEPDRYQVS